MLEKYLLWQNLTELTFVTEYNVPAYIHIKSVQTFHVLYMYLMKSWAINASSCAINASSWNRYVMYILWYMKHHWHMCMWFTKLYYIDIYTYVWYTEIQSIHDTITNVYRNTRYMQYVEIMYVSNGETNNVHLMHLDTVLTYCTHTVIALIIDFTISVVLNISYNNYNGMRQQVVPVQAFCRMWSFHFF